MLLLHHRFIVPVLSCAAVAFCRPVWGDDTAAAPSDKAAQLKVETPPAELKLDPFYKKYVNADGYPIVSSEKVSDYALREAAYLVNLMLAKRPDVRHAMIASGSRMVVMGHDEFTTDIPEYQDFKPKDFWDRRARGLGGSETDPLCSVAEENLLAYPGDPYSTECILIHEFAHNIHLRGMVNIDPTFDKRLKKAYDDALARGLWATKYASTNHYEYFAEGVQSWFDNNRPPDHDHNGVHTRKQLKEYDPGLAAMCEEVFGETQLVYSYPVTRLAGHLASYDPTKAPKFVWPARLQELGEQIKREALAKRPAVNKGQEDAKQPAATAPAGEQRRERETPSVDPAPLKYKTRVIEGWTVHIREELFDHSPKQLEQALQLLEVQLKEIERVVPANPVNQLKRVPLWISPEYPGSQACAEYHPDPHWLSAHGRNPEMAKGVEFTNVRIFEAETKRMPVFVLHELAHAYHDRVIGFDDFSIRAAYEQAKKSGLYDSVERSNGPDRPKTHERAYAMTNDREYFAESTEAYFGRNDFFPYTRDELERHDPEICKLLAWDWHVTAPGGDGSKP